MDRPIVLCGLGRMGWGMLDYLRAAGLPVVVIDTGGKADDPRLAGVRLVTGDCRRADTLREAGVPDARGVLVLTSDDLVNVTTVLAVRAVAPDVPVVLRMFNQNLIGRLGQAVRNVTALSTSLLAAPILAFTALTGHDLGTFRVGDRPDSYRQVAEITVAEGSGLAGRTVHDAAGDLIVFAHIPATGNPRFLLDVDRTARLGDGDRLVVCGEPRQVTPLLAGGEQEAPHLRWAGWLRRTGRAARNALGSVDLALKICTGILIGVVAFSTLLFHLTVNDSVADSLFRTISLMATGADMRERDYHAAWIKVYVSSLRIVGAALTAAFTAILTNYLIRARLGGALEVRRMPEGGHVVLAGLTPVAFRVVEELRGLGEPVVVLERDPDNRFVTTARRLGAVVTIGDAAVIESLRQANAATARAVIAATNNDITNLEVTLLARELNAQQRCVLLLGDPQLARMLRDAAGVRRAVSVPALAAPAFLAALFGDRVQSVFLVRDRLLAVIDLVVHTDDVTLTGQSVRAVAVDYRLLPVALLPAEGPPSPSPLNARLGVGDRLVAVVALSDLDRLLRRQPAEANVAVEASAFPLPARGWLIGLLRVSRGLDAEAAEKAMQALPVCVGENLTRGQAEDLLARLDRERVTAHLRGPDRTE